VLREAPGVVNVVAEPAGGSVIETPGGIGGGFGPLGSVGIDGSGGDIGSAGLVGVEIAGLGKLFVGMAGLNAVTSPGNDDGLLIVAMLGSVDAIGRTDDMPGGSDDVLGGSVVPGVVFMGLMGPAVDGEAVGKFGGGMGDVFGRSARVWLVGAGPICDGGRFVGTFVQPTSPRLTPTSAARKSLRVMSDSPSMRSTGDSILRGGGP
jgi:hypothetical protein